MSYLPPFSIFFKFTDNIPGTQIVLVHGLSIPAIVWKDVAPALAKKGFRVMVYGEVSVSRGKCLTHTDAFVCSLADLYGRGYSDAPQIPYDTALYVTQLALLMQHVKLDKAIICGLSMVWTHIFKFTGILHTHAKKFAY